MTAWHNGANDRSLQLSERMSGPRPITHFVWSADPEPDRELTDDEMWDLAEKDHQADLAAWQAEQDAAEAASPEYEAGA